VALAATIAFLPAVVADARTQLARARSVRPLAAALLQRLQPGDVVTHEGPLDASASLLLVLKEPVRIVNGLQATSRSAPPSPRRAMSSGTRRSSSAPGPVRRASS
jgi:hypothetical protein